jgi:ketopantoate reductase
VTQGITFEVDFMQQINETFAPSPNIASMLQDLRRGRPTEIDYMNGAVARLGAEHGVPCPVNQALTDIIKAMEAQSRLLLPEEMFETQSAQARLGLLTSRASG